MVTVWPLVTAVARVMVTVLPEMLSTLDGFTPVVSPAT